MTAEELQSLIATGLPCDHLEVTGDGRHWYATIVSGLFAGIAGGLAAVEYLAELGGDAGDRRRRLDVAFARMLAQRPESAALLSDALGALAAYAPAAPRPKMAQFFLIKFVNCERSRSPSSGLCFFARHLDVPSQAYEGEAADSPIARVNLPPPQAVPPMPP